MSLILTKAEDECQAAITRSIVPNVSGSLQCTTKPLEYVDPLLRVMKVPLPKQSQVPHILFSEDLSFVVVVVFIIFVHMYVTCR